MYANNVSNLDQILSSLQCYLVRTRLDTHSPSLVFHLDEDKMRDVGRQYRGVQFMR